MELFTFPINCFIIIIITLYNNKELRVTEGCNGHSVAFKSLHLRMNVFQMIMMIILSPTMNRDQLEVILPSLTHLHHFLLSNGMKRNLTAILNTITRLAQSKAYKCMQPQRQIYVYIDNIVSGIKVIDIFNFFVTYVHNCILFQGLECTIINSVWQVLGPLEIFNPCIVFLILI